MQRQLLQTPESLVHVALGAATAYYSPWLALGYGVYQYSNNSTTSGGCPGYIVQGVEYGLGYFGALLAYETFTQLSY